MARRTIFPGWRLPALLVVPQLLLTFAFFLWPAVQGIADSLTQQDAFGVTRIFVGLDNFTDLFSDPLYRAAAWRSLAFIAAVCVLAIGVALILAAFADEVVRGRNIYRTLLIWPYAVAPPIAAIIWVLLMNPEIGLLGRALNRWGLGWDYAINGGQAMLMVVIASAWKQVSYNFIFLVAGLQSIPRAVVEAARLDGARGLRRFATITFPLLTPTLVFLLVVNIVYAAFETFGTIQALTKGGPGQATQTLMVKVYRDGIVNQDIGSSATQSVVLMLGVILLTAVQFRILRRRA